MLTPTQTFVWPNPQHEQLLKAIFLSGDAALNAWQIWQAQTAAGKLDFGSRQLLPLLYRKLLQLGLIDSQLVEYKHHYRLNWAKNHYLLHKASSLLQAFHTAGIETWVLKGTGMILLCYQDFALRPMVDCDVLVQRQQAKAAIEVLIQLGWYSTSFDKLSLFTPRYFSIRHAHGFNNAENCNIDLHWRVFNGADIPFKEHSLPVTLFNVPTKTLSFTDHLLHACVHGISENVGKKLLWVCDAMFILQNESAIDWQYLAFQAHKFHMSLSLYDTLLYLQERLQAPIPTDFFAALRKIPVTRLVRNEHYYKTHPAAKSFIGTLFRSWHQHARLGGFRNFLHRLVTYPRYLQLTWGVHSLWRLPVSGVRIIKQRFGRKK